MRSEKICVLTQPLWNNYGALLQAWALQRVISKAGYEVVTDRFPRRFPSFWANNIDRAKRIVAHYLLGRKSVNPFPFYAKRKDWKTISENTDAFVQNNISVIDFFEGQTLPSEENVAKYDTFVVGSDQVWRDSYGRVESYFCDFAKGKNKKLIAYAASFGLKDWQFDSKRTENLMQLAKNFQAISVRENDAVGLCKDNLGLDVLNVLDPTLLLDSEDYDRLIEKADLSESEGDMMVYILDKNQEKQDFIDKVSRKLNLKAFTVMPDKVLGKDTRRCDSRCVYPKVEKWLKGFKDAKFVLTDSFHGMVFSIIYRKPFAVIANKERGVSRFTSLLSSLGLEDRLFFESAAMNLESVAMNLDFDKVERRLFEMKTLSLQFLISNLEN